MKCHLACGEGTWAGVWDEGVPAICSRVHLNTQTSSTPELARVRDIGLEWTCSSPPTLEPDSGVFPGRCLVWPRSSNNRLCTQHSCSLWKSSRWGPLLFSLISFKIIINTLMLDFWLPTEWWQPLLMELNTFYSGWQHAASVLVGPRYTCETLEINHVSHFLQRKSFWKPAFYMIDYSDILHMHAACSILRTTVSSLSCTFNV